MAHNIMEFDQVGLAETGAWHRLGTVVPADMAVRDAVQRFLGWQVAIQPLFIKHPVTGEFVEVADHRATVRQDVGVTLGVVGGNYDVIQNTDMVEDVEALCGEGGAKVHTVGSLRNGRLVWVLLRLQEKSLLGKDEAAQFIAVMSSHDRSVAYTVVPTTVRVVCNNTMQMALRDGANSALRVVHSGRSKDRIKQARGLLGAVHVEFAQFRDLCGMLAGRRVSDTFADWVFSKVVPGDVNKSAAVLEHRLLLQSAFRNPRGGLTRSVDRTAFGVFNAVTEYVDYMARTRSTGGRSNDEARAESALLGAGSRKREHALELLAKVAADRNFGDLMEAGDSATPVLDAMLAAN